MPSVRTLATLKRGGIYHPPGSTFHDLTEDEIADLGEHVVRFDAPAVAPGSPGAAIVPELHPLPVAAVAPLLGASLAPPVNPADGGDDEEETRIDRVRFAIDLLEPHDFAVTGRPKLAPLAAVLGFKPSADEITTALAMREDEGL